LNTGRHEAITRSTPIDRTLNRIADSFQATAASVDQGFMP